MNIQESANIKSVSSWDSGGGIAIDVVVLHDGKVLGITEDAVVLYADIDDLMHGNASVKRPSISL